MRRLAPAVLAVLLVAAAACSSDDGADDQVDTAEPITAEAVLVDAARAMAAIDTVRFELLRTGADVYIDDADTIAFVDATGRFAAPGSAEALVSVELAGLTAQIGAVAIDGEIWLTNPLTGDWEPAPDDLTFDPAILFDPEVGWRALLETGLTDVELLGTADGLHHLSGVAAAERVDVLTGGLVDVPAPIELWIATDTSLIDRVTFDVEVDAGVAEWDVTLTDYGTEVTITVPPLGGG